MVEKIRKHAESMPDSLAVAYKKEQLTYSELYRRIVNIGSVLEKHGIRKNDRVLFTAESRPEMAATYLGIQLRWGNLPLL